MHGSSGPQEESVRRLDDQFIRFCITRYCAQHTQTERHVESLTTLRAPCVAGGCVCACHAGDAGYYFLRELDKLPLIEDRGQTDRVTILVNPKP